MNSERYLIVTWFKDGHRTYGFYHTRCDVDEQMDKVWADKDIARYKVVDLENCDVLDDVVVY